MILSKKATSFVELLVAVSILSVTIVGMVEVFAMASNLGNMSTNLSLALIEASNKMEELRHADFSSIVVDYSQGGVSGNVFNLSMLPGKGVITIDAANPDLLMVTIDVCYRNKNNRVTGEDLNLDGFLDSGEDLNANGKIDSSASISSYIARR